MFIVFAADFNFTRLIKLISLNFLTLHNIMKRKHLLILTLIALSFGFDSIGQTISQGGLNTLYCPQYTSSGSSTRMVTYFKVTIPSLTPGIKYYYTTRACASQDLNTTYGGVGGSVYLSNDSPSRYVGNPNFSSGNFDSFVITNPLNGMWFAFVNSTNTRFSAGKYVFPLLTIKDSVGSFSVKFALSDSIKVLGFSSSAGANNGTGVYGLSKGEAKNMVLLYDTSQPNFRRPLTIGMIEDDGMLADDHRAPSFYKTNADGEDGAWGGLLPNTLDRGIRKIDRRDFESNQVLHSNVDSDGTWLSLNTKNPRGGATTPIKFTVDEAALVSQEVSFVSPFASVSEDDGSFPIRIKRSYSSEDTAKITLTLIGGTATNNSDFVFSGDTTILFPPGIEKIDTISLPITDDLLTEGNEVVTFKIINPINTSRSSDSSLSLTITDNDVPTIQFKSSIVKTREGLGDALAQVNITNGTSGTTTVDAVVKSKSALTTIPGEFYLSFNSSNDTTLSFSNGIATDSLILNGFVVDESSIDAPDTIVVVLRNPSGTAVLGPDSIVTFIIDDNDAPPGVRFVTQNKSINEKDGTVDVQIELLFRNNNPSDFSLQFVSSRSTASEGLDFTFNPTSKIYSYGTSGSDTITVSVPIINDELFEADETLVFSIQGTVNCQTYTPDSLTLTLESDDLERVTIADATATKLTDGVALREGDKVRVTGVTHGFNRRTTGYEFTLIDATGGIQVFDFSPSFGYAYKEGDSLSIDGTINQFNGVTQIRFFDTIILHKSGVALNQANVINTLGELSEMEHVRMNSLRFLNPSEWPTSALTANTFKYIEARNSLGDTIRIKIDAEGPLDGTAAPDSNLYYDIIGIGSQSDNTNPFLHDYHIIPNNVSDVAISNSPTVNFASTSLTFAETMNFTDDISINFTNTGSQNVGFRIVDEGSGTALSPKDYSFSPILVGEPSSSTSFTFKVDLSDDIDEDGDKTIKIALREPIWGVLIGSDSVLTITLDDNESSIQNLKSIGISVYPNPTNDRLIIKGSSHISEVKVINSLGKEVLLQNTGNTSEINTSSLTTGLYTILVKVNGVYYTGRINKK
jgi:hypothetical protein